MALYYFESWYFVLLKILFQQMSYKLYSPQSYATAGAKVELFLRFIEFPV